MYGQFVVYMNAYCCAKYEANLKPKIVSEVSCNSPVLPARTKQIFDIVICESKQEEHRCE